MGSLSPILVRKAIRLEMYAKKMGIRDHLRIAASALHVPTRTLSHAVTKYKKGEKRKRDSCGKRKCSVCGYWHKSKCPRCAPVPKMKKITLELEEMDAARYTVMRRTKTLFLTGVLDASSRDGRKKLPAGECHESKLISPRANEHEAPKVETGKPTAEDL